MMKDIKQQRRDWMLLCKNLTLKCYEVESRLGDVCPSRYTTAEKAEKVKALKGIAVVSKEISVLAGNLIELEREAEIGFSKILGRPATELEVVVLSVLFAARLESSLRHQARTVGDVVSLVSYRDPERALAARCLFRSDSPIYPVVWLKAASSLDEFSATVTEKSFNTALGLSDDITAQYAEVQCLGGGRWR